MIGKKIGDRSLITEEDHHNGTALLGMYNVSVRLPPSPFLLCLEPSHNVTETLSHTYKTGWNTCMHRISKIDFGVRFLP